MSTQDTFIPGTAVAVLPPSGVSGGDIDVPIERIHRFSVEEYNRLVEVGILHPRQPVELIEGIIVDMSPVGIAHRYAVEELLYSLLPLVMPRWYVSVQQPVVLPRSEPEPDIVIVRGSHRDYPDRHPGPGDIGLVVEVAESSLDFDRRTKGFLYAQHQVPEYWIVNLIDRCVEVYRSDPAKAYRFLPAEVYVRTQSVPLVLDGHSLGALPVASLVPDEKRP